MINLNNNHPQILVLGDLMIDQYLWGSCDRISPEAPVQVINVHSDTSLLGGAGNVVKNLHMLGAKVDLISVIGNCETSKEIKILLKNIGISSKYLITQKDRITSKKNRIIASQQQVIRYDRESSEDLNLKSQNTIIKVFTSIVQNYELVLLSDYGKGIFTYDLTQSLIRIAKKYSKKVLIDPKGDNYAKYNGAFMLTPNKKEAMESSQIDIKDEASLLDSIIKLKSKCDLDVSLVTLSENGVAVYDDKFRIHSTTAKEVFDVTGAGDTVLASLGFSIACGLKIDQAVKFSNLAAGVVVGKIGSATASLKEIIEYDSSINKSSSDKHIKTFEEIIPLISDLKLRNKKIVFTNGCFDLIHAGHVSFLESAKSFGDILILGLNSDRSVTALKGKDRPINSQDDRALILAAFKVVDYVVIFNENTPFNLIKSIKPHILVKGGDYAGKEIVGQDIADEVKIVEFLDGKSSTNTIEKILKKY